MNRQLCVRMLIGMPVVLLFCLSGPLVARQPLGSKTQTLDTSRNRGHGSSGSSSSAGPSGSSGSSESHGGFDWEHDWPSVVGPMLQGGSRPQPQPHPQPYPTPHPSYPSHGDYRPVYPGNVIQVYPEENRPQYHPLPPPSPYRPPQTIHVTPPANVAVPEENVVTVEVPRQSSPMDGRTWEVSVREARCYSGSLAEVINRSLGEIMSSVGKGADVAAMHQQIQAIQQMIAANNSWRQMESAVRALVEENPAASREGVRERFQHILQMILVRDAFLTVGKSKPRSRGGPIELRAIPTGVIWVVFDPTLPVGTGLFVSDNVMVCGSGGRGDLWIAQASAASALGLPVGIGDPIPDVTADDDQSPDDLVIISNKKGASNTVHYVLSDGKSYSLKPGFQQKLDADGRWTVEFDRGNRQGTARYSLSRGAYEFRIEDDKWELFKLSFDVTIDNRDSEQDFQAVIANEVVTVPAGQSVTHKSKVPVIVEFDRGAGSDDLARKNLNKSGTFKVAVNADTNYLDLFAEAEPPNKGPLATATN
jgi:hypothetical protein